jgi:hypothetical protein
VVVDKVSRRHQQRQHEMESVLTRCDTVNAAHGALRRAFANRDRAPAAWRAAAHAFRDALAAVYTPDFDAALDAVRGGDTAAIDVAIAFLEADPWCDRSGYAKQTIMQRLRAEHLSTQQRQRLGQVLLHHVEVGNRREFRTSCRLARRLNPIELRQALHHRIATSDPATRRRALWMLTAMGRPRFTPDEVLIVRNLLLEELDEDSWWNQQAWMIHQARNVADPGWVDTVYTFATCPGPGSVAAARLLPHLLARPTLEQCEALAQRIVDVIDDGGGETWFEALAPTADTPALRRQLEHRRNHPDPDTMRRARWALRALGLPSGW